MKSTVALLLLLVSGSMGSLSKPSLAPLDMATYTAMQQKASGVDLDLCPICINFAGDFINELLNIVLNAGVVGGCEELCQLLEDKVHSQLADVVCNILCDYVGIKEFINIIEKSDLDPIYYCELLRACPVKDNGDAHILSFIVKPKDVEYGSKFHIELLFQTHNGTGTGEIDLEIDTVDGVPFGEDELLEELKPGAYNVTWDIHAKRDPNCDPTQGPCETWESGNYTANVAICNGECGSKHPHSEIYDTAEAPFKVKDNN